MNAVHDREKVELSAGQTEAVRKCFADLDTEEQKKVYVNPEGPNRTLTPKGSALLAQRVNYALNKDELIASLINQNIADKKLLIDQYGVRLCEDEKQIVHKLLQIRDIKPMLEPLVQFVGSNCP